MKAMRMILAVTAVAVFATTASASVLLNEFQPNPAGSDPANQNFELLGTPGASFNGWILSIEGDNTSGMGTVDRATNVSGTFDMMTGLLVVSIPDLENPTFTVVLLDGAGGFTGTAGTTDIDTDNDGVADDLSTFGTVLDALGSPDNVSDEGNLYGTQLGGTDMSAIGTIEPNLVFRDSSSLDWYAVTYEPAVYDASATAVDAGLFNIDPTAGDTFGSANPTIPEPTTLALLGFGGLFILRRRHN